MALGFLLFFSESECFIYGLIDSFVWVEVHRKLKSPLFGVELECLLGPDVNTVGGFPYPFEARHPCWFSHYEAIYYYYDKAAITKYPKRPMVITPTSIYPMNTPTVLPTTRGCIIHQPNAHSSNNVTKNIIIILFYLVNVSAPTFVLKARAITFVIGVTLKIANRLYCIQYAG